MKNRFSTFGKHTTRMLCVLAACGLAWSCKDDFILDDEKPSWLNASIYESLEQSGNFSTYLKLLKDPDLNPVDSATGEYIDRPLSEILSRTGSKTVFVANDEAWDAFFKRNATLPANNPWHNATSYERLSVAQKTLLIHSSMLNNAIVMENLASSDGTSTQPPTRGQYMRRATDVKLTDTITYVPADEVPYTFNEKDKNYWRRFRAENGGKGIYLVQDSTPNMMLHFTSEHMSLQGITDNDFAIFMGRPRNTSDVHIYDALLLQKDGVAENGYVNVTEKVATPLPNMAEVIRTNGLTNIFSHILDRFSYPAYNPTVTRDYNDMHKNAQIDSIFTKHYFAQIGPNHQPQLWGPDGEKFQDSDGEVALKFDPGWNAFYDELNYRADMASMFVPSDEILWEYFAEGGGGWQLVQTYADDPSAPVAKGDYDALYKKIDDIPLSTLQALVNVIMFRSFTGSVPSKMSKLRNDAQEDMFTTDDIQNIDTCLLANNGAVYIMKKVYGPADYTSVLAPAYISKKNLVMKWAISNGAIESQDQMKLNYYAYLKAMKSRFTFFLPSDEALQRYYDPVSFTSLRPRALALKFTGKGTFPLDKSLFSYDPATGTIGRAYNNEQISNDEVINRLKDILESHTIVHDGTNPIDSEDEYYVTKNGSAVKMTRDAQGNVIAVQGGYQLENERAGISGDLGTVSINVDMANTHNMENGRTYVLNDSPIIPASKSVYGILYNTKDEQGEDPFQEFYDLTAYNEKIILDCGLVNSGLQAKDRNRQLKKFQTFIDDGGVDNNVQFFNNYRYTVFVPSNDAIREAVAKGLPTWESIIEDYESLEHPLVDSLDSKGKVVKDENGEPYKVYDTSTSILSRADSLRLQAKITYLNNFIRGHFLDNSIFADKSEVKERDFITSSYNTELGVFVKVHCSRVKAGGETLLKVRDDNGGPLRTVVNYKNIMARDLNCTRNGKAQTPTSATTMNNIMIQGSSFAVIHQIDGVLNHTELNADGTYGIDWNDANACKAYLKKFALPSDIKSLKNTNL